MMIEALLKEIARCDAELFQLGSRKHYGNLTAKLISRFEGRKRGLQFALELAEVEVETARREKENICPECSKPMWSSTAGVDGLVTFVVDKCVCKQ